MEVSLTLVFSKSHEGAAIGRGIVKEMPSLKMGEVNFVHVRIWLANVIAHFKNEWGVFLHNAAKLPHLQLLLKTLG